MKRKIAIALLPVFIACNFFSQTLNPTCGQGYFYKMGLCLSSYSAGTGTLTGWTQNYPGSAEGIAVAPAFGFSAPDPTFWTVVNGIYYYYNGTSFVSTGHSAGGNAFKNPGGSRDFIYNIDTQGNVSVYNGTGNATLLASFPSLTSTNVVQDIVGDSNNNFYLVRNSSPAAVLVFDQTGALSCTYAISPPTGTTNGLAITANKLIIGNGGTGYLYELVGETMNNNGSTTLAPCLGTSNDLASCPAEAGLFSAISSASNALSCMVNSIALTSQDPAGSATYSWSGPGIAGASNTQSVTVSAPGIYTRTAVNCAGLSSAMCYTVKYDSTRPPLTVYQAAKTKCAQHPPVLLSVNGYANYFWTPLPSLSNATASVVYASPSVTTTYSVTGLIKACSSTTYITVYASPLPIPQIQASTDSICKGAVVALSVEEIQNCVWQPGTIAGVSIQALPQINTTYTATVTDHLGCTASNTKYIAVIDKPGLQVSVSDNEICQGDNIVIVNKGADKYSLSPGTISGATVILNPSASTVFTITGWNWKCANTGTVEVLVHLLPVISAVISNSNACAGDAVVITASGAQSYFWDGQPGHASHQVTAQGASFYKVTGTDNNGCSSELTVPVTASECTGLASLPQAHRFIIFPNPSDGFLYVQNGLQDPCHMEILDCQGKRVQHIELQNGQNSMQLKGLAAGIYYVRIISGGQTCHASRLVVR